MNSKREVIATLRSAALEIDDVKSQKALIAIANRISKSQIIPKFMPMPDFSKKQSPIITPGSMLDPERGPTSHFWKDLIVNIPANSYEEAVAVLGEIENLIRSDSRFNSVAFNKTPQLINVNNPNKK